MLCSLGLLVRKIKEGSVEDVAGKLAQKLTVAGKKNVNRDNRQHRSEGGDPGDRERAPHGARRGACGHAQDAGRPAVHGATLSTLRCSRLTRLVYTQSQLTFVLFAVCSYRCLMLDRTFCILA